MQNMPKSLKDLDETNHGLIIQETSRQMNSLSHDKHKDVCGWDVDNDIKEYSLDYIKVLNSKLKDNHANKLSNFKNPRDNQGKSELYLDASRETSLDDNNNASSIKYAKFNTRHLSQYSIASNKDLNPNNINLTNGHVTIHTPTRHNSYQTSKPHFLRGSPSTDLQITSILLPEKKRQNSSINLNQTYNKKPLECLMNTQNNLINIQSLHHHSANNSPKKILSVNNIYNKIQAYEQARSNLLIGSNTSSITLKNITSLGSDSLTPLNSDSTLKKSTMNNTQNVEPLTQRKRNGGSNDPPQSKIPLLSFQYQQKLFLERNRAKPNSKLLELSHVKSTHYQIKHERKPSNEKTNALSEGPVSRTRFNLLDVLNERDLTIGQSVTKYPIVSYAKGMNFELLPQGNTSIYGHTSSGRVITMTGCKIEEQTEINTTESCCQQGLNLMNPCINFSLEKCSDLLLKQGNKNTHETPKRLATEKLRSRIKSKELFLGINSDIMNISKGKQEIEPLYSKKYENTIKKLKNKKASQLLALDGNSLSIFKIGADEEKPFRARKLEPSMQFINNSRNELLIENNYIMKTNAFHDLRANPFLHTHYINTDTQSKIKLAKSTRTMTTAINQLKQIKKERFHHGLLPKNPSVGDLRNFNQRKRLQGSMIITNSPTALTLESYDRQSCQSSR